MKLALNPDFLRGIIFASLVHSCFKFIGALWIGLYPHFQPTQAGPSFLLLAVYLFLLWCLSFHPVRSAKTVFVFLSLFSLIPIASAFYFMNSPSGVLPRSAFTLQYFTSLSAALAVAVIAYLHYRARVHHQA